MNRSKVIIFYLYLIIRGKKFFYTLVHIILFLRNFHKRLLRLIDRYQNLSDSNQRATHAIKTTHATQATQTTHAIKTTGKSAAVG